MKNITDAIKTFIEIGKQFTFRWSEEKALEFICRKSIELMKPPNLFVILHDKLTDQVRIFLAFENGEKTEIGDQEQLFRRIGKQKVEQIIQTKKRIILHNRDAVKGCAESPEETYACWLGVPMSITNRAIGAFIVYDPTQEGVYDDEDAEILDAITDLAANEIDHAHLTRRFELLAKVEKELTDIQSDNERSVLEFIYQKVQEFEDIDTRKLSIILQDRFTEELSVVLSEGKFTNLENIYEQTQLLEQIGRGNIRWIIQNQKPLLLETHEYVEKRIETTDEDTPAWWVGVPMRLGKRTIGVFVTYHPEQKHIFTWDDAKILDIVSDQAANAIDRTRLTGRLNTLSKIKKALSSLFHLTIEQVLEIVIRQAQEITDTYNLCILLHEEATDALKLVLAYRKYSLVDLTDPNQRDEIWGNIPITAIKEIIQTNEPVLLATRDEVQATFVQPRKDRLPATWLGVPMRLREKTIGVFAIYHMKFEEVYDDNDIQILDDLSDQVAIAIDNAELFQKVQTRLDQRVNDLEMLQEVYASVGTKSLQKVLELILEKSIAITAGNYADLWLFNPKTEEIWVEVESQKKEGKILMRPGQLRLKLDESKSIVGHVVTSGKSYVCPDITHDEYYYPCHDVTSGQSYSGETGDVKSELAIPLRYQDEIFGVLNFESSKPSAFTEEHKRLLEALAGQAAIAINNARLYNELEIRVHERTSELEQVNEKLRDEIAERERLEKLQNSLYKISEAAHTANKLEELFPLIHNIVSELMYAKNFYIALYDSDTDTLSFAYSEDEVDKRSHVPRKLKRGLTEYVLRTEKPLLSSPEVRKKLIEQGEVVPIGTSSASWLGVPLKIQERTIGVLAVQTYTEGIRYGEREKEILIFVSEQIASAIERVRAEERLRELLRQTSEQLNQRIVDLRSLQEVYGAIEKEPLQDVLELIIEKAAELTASDYGDIWLLDQNQEKLVFAVEYGSKRFSTSKPEPANIDGKSIVAWVVREGQSYLSNDVKTDANYWETIEDAQSELAVPLRVRNQIIGVLDVESKALNRYEESHRKLLETLADQAAIAIHNARLTEQSTSLNQQQAVLIDLGQKLTSGIQLNEDEILKLIYNNVTELMDTTNMYIAYYDELTDTVSFGLVYVNGIKIDTEKDERYKPRSGGEGKTEYIIRKKVPLFQSTKAEVEAWYRTQTGRTDYVKLSDSPSSWVGVPMIKGDKVIGVIATYPTKEYFYTKDDVEILQAMANIAAIALYNARLYSQTQELQDEVIAAKQLGTLSTAFGAIQHRISNTFDIINPNVRRLRRRVDPTDQETNEILDIIERNVKYTSDIIARIQEPLKQTEIQTVDINAILSEIEKETGEQWQTDPSRPLIAVTLTFDDSLPRIRASSGLIAEVFHNLFDNAYRAMRKGGELTVSSQWTDKMVQVRVQDTGDGIPLEIQERLFKKPVPSKESGGGAGLGLWLNKLILQSLGGNIAIEKTDAAGTTVLVEIPAIEKKEG